MRDSDLVEEMALAMHEEPINWARPTPWEMLSENIREEWRKKARVGLRVAARALETRYGELHPGCVALRAALTES